MSIISHLVRTAAAAAALAAGAAHAGTISLYSDQAAWSAAAGGSTVVEDFSDSTLQPGFGIAQAGTIFGGVYDATAVTQFNDAGNPLWTFGSTSAFGADFDLAPGGRGSSLILAIDFVDGSSAAQAVIANPATGTFAGFFGLVASTAIKSVRFDSSGAGQEEFSADNLRFTTAGSGGGGGTVPEPASWALAGLGMAAACMVRRRRPQAARA